jgi:dinuclear metal center YbgI/SA1388 family protein
MQHDPEFRKILEQNQELIKKNEISGKDLEKFLSAIYDSEKFNDFCPNGLQVQGKDRISSVFTAVSASQEIIEKAIHLKADALIVHHGLFWSGQKNTITGTLYKRIKSLMENGINLYAYHLPMDGHPIIGNGIQLAKELQISKIEPFIKYRGNFLGVKGQFQTAISIDKVAENLEKKLNRKPQIFGQGKSKVKKVAIVTGGGQKEFVSAIAQGQIDLFITGEVSENNYYEANEENVFFVSAGHYATEKFGPRALAKLLQSIKQFRLTGFIDVPNPV